MNDAVMESIMFIWQTPAMIPPSCKRSDRKYISRQREQNFSFHPMPNSVVVDTVNKRDRQSYPQNTPYNKDWKRFYLFG